MVVEELPRIGEGLAHIGDSILDVIRPPTTYLQLHTQAIERGAVAEVQQRNVDTCANCTTYGLVRLRALLLRPLDLCQLHFDIPSNLAHVPMRGI